MNYGVWESIPKDSPRFLSATKNSPTGFYDFHQWTVDIDVARYSTSNDQIEDQLATLADIQRTEDFSKNLHKAITKWWHQHHQDLTNVLEPSLTKEEIIGSSFGIIERGQFKRALQCIRYTIVVRTYWDYLSDVNNPDSLYQKFEMPMLLRVVIDAPEP